MSIAKDPLDSENTSTLYPIPFRGHRSIWDAILRSLWWWVTRFTTDNADECRRKESVPNKASIIVFWDRNNRRPFGKVRPEAVRQNRISRMRFKTYTIRRCTSMLVTRCKLLLGDTQLDFFFFFFFFLSLFSLPFELSNPSEYHSFEKLDKNKSVKLSLLESTWI